MNTILHAKKEGCQACYERICNALKGKILTSIYLLFALVYSTISFAQTFPPASSCTSKDLELVSATLTGGDVCNTCTPGQTINRTLTLAINNKTGSTRTSFAFWGTLEIYNSDGTLASSTSRTGCNGPVAPNQVTSLPFGTITYECGQSLKITNLFLAWTSASPGETCPLNSADIAPKCGTLPEIQINAGVNGILAVTNVTCFNGNNGAINLTPNGGTPPYTYQWSASNGGVVPPGQATNQDLTGLVAGTYSVIITDSKNCSTTKMTSVTAPAQLAAPTASVTQPTCAVGTGTITVSAPLGATLTYSINGTTYQSSPTFNNVAPGTYTVTVKNSDGCISAGTQKTVNPQPGTPDAPTASVTQPTCAVGTGTITVSAPLGATLTYSINGTTYQSSPTFNNVAPGTYTVTVKNSDGCISAGTQKTVNPQPGTPDAPTASVTQPTCAVGTGTITVSAPLGATLTYSINGTTYQSSPTFNNVAPGTYTVTVKNSDGCISAGTQKTVNPQPGTPDAPTASVTQPTCAVGTGTITVSAPLGATLTYSINGTTYQSSPTFNNVAPGTYTVTVKNSDGCISAGTQKTVNPQPGTPDAPTASVTQPTCAVGTGTITVSAPLGATLTYSINGTTYQSSPTFNNVAPGTYTVTVKNSDGCISAGTQKTVNPQPGTPDAPTASVTQPTCAVGTGTITVSAPLGATLTYSINGTTYQSSPTFNNVAPGTYTVTVKNSDGCISAGTQKTVNPQPGTPDAPTASVTQPTCAVGTGTITVSAPLGATLTYSINGTTYQSSPTFNNVAPGTYTVTVKNSDGCISAGTQKTVNPQPGTPDAPTASVTQPTCAVGTGTITVSAPLGATLTYSINGTTYQSSPTFNNVAPGTYTVTVKNSDGCISSATPAVVNTQPPCTVSFCSYTQGFYGNKNGLAMLPSLLTTPITIGRVGHSLIIPANSAAVRSAAKLNSMLPGGSTPAVLKAGDCNIMTSCISQYLTKQGRINNVLLSQTITLTLNTRLKGGILSSFPIQSGYIVTQGGCTKLNSSVVKYLTANGMKTATVSDLLALANDVLGRTKTAGVGGVPSLSNINNAVDAINNIFDGCKNFVGYFSTCPYSTTTTVTTSVQGIKEQPENPKDLKVSTYPNPFSDKIRFVIESPVSGKGSLELYNMLGQKVRTLFQGHVTEGISQVVEYQVPPVLQGSLMYTFSINGKQVSGKLMNLKQ